MLKKARMILLPGVLLVTSAFMLAIEQNGIGNYIVAAASTHEQARLSDKVSIHTIGSGSPLIGFREGHDIQMVYDGNMQLQRGLDAGAARPLALATADFDENGVPDLLGSYASSAGLGLVTLY